MSPLTSAHLEGGELLADVLGELLPPGRRAHLESCPRCQLDRLEVATLAADMRDDRCGLAGDTLVAEVEQLFDRMGPPGPEAREARIVRAVRQGAGEAASVRGVAGEERALYSGASVDVDLALAPEAGGIGVRGQVLVRSAGVEPTLIVAEVNGRAVGQSPIGAHGRFRFEKPVPEPFDLVLDLGEVRLRIGPLPGTST